ncbi:beta-lactamase family protein [Streptomyces sp. RLB3-17]|uniref:serine hydrolase domain-containing protein n=1 Tax=Streptomyces TaxID=1883 RepID=UPI0011624A8E|nr:MULTISPECIES: serine hydrolase domain-containing protein [Streptomyces]MCX5347157.1 beta-lactamase family protein [Streptomyces mirabilis]QDN76196.1 beta-lactamase family protein [Streptomyces sp. S1A1-7]QDN85880.1 beta-lactamase family protein [Streptomyces sp. RLB3-6]QDO06692.1 beta-lactamase family protein [Streptomyces sp. S1D4-23]QDO38307.1 beta-lactamase family protein [Streptomyces sp. RLB3-17]
MTQPAPRVHGHCDARFAAVRTAFEENFRDRDELGAAVTVTLDGESVVDLWGGWADAARTRPWERETLVNVWSTSKGPTALCAHILADRGLLDFDAPVAAYWPEFAAAGKESVLVRHLLSHRAGLAGLREPHDLAQLCDWELTVERLAAQEPWWEPGTRSGYHALTFGHLVGEVVRRVSGLRPGAFLEREVTGPLGIDFTIGLPEKETERAAELVHPRVASSSEQAAIFAQLAPAAVAALANPLVGAAEANTARWRAAEIPAANGHGTARAVAALYGIFAGRGAYGSRQVLSPEAAERVREGQGSCRDLVLGAGFEHETETGLGLWLSGPNGSYGPNPRAFGHDGFGGSCGLADPESGLSLGYVMNRMGPHIADDPRKMALVDALYSAL